MNLSRRTLLGIVLGCVVLGCGLAQPVAADGPSSKALSVDASDRTPTLDQPVSQPPAAQTTTESGSHDDDAHETNGTATEGHDSTDDHDESGAHGAAGGNGGADSVHLVLEGLQILFAFAAVGAVVLVGRVYGGEIGRALFVSGLGVTLFAVQRLWHNIHELGFLVAPSELSAQVLFILASGALAAGYLSLYRTMTTRTG